MTGQWPIYKDIPSYAAGNVLSDREWISEGVYAAVKSPGNRCAMMFITRRGDDGRLYGEADCYYLDLEFSVSDECWVCSKFTEKAEPSDYFAGHLGYSI